MVATSSLARCTSYSFLRQRVVPQSQHDERRHGTRPADYLHFPLAERARGCQLGESVPFPRRSPQPVGEIVDPCLPAGLEDPVDLGPPAGRVRPVVQGDVLTTPSTSSSESGSTATSPTSNRTLSERPALAARRAASSTITSEISTPVSVMPGASRASRTASRPGPLPTSTKLPPG